MPRHKKRLSATTGILKPAFSMSAQEWTNVEGNYGRKLSTETRKLIEGATIRYLWLDQMERNALPLTTADNLVSAAEKSAQILLKQLNALDPRPTFDPDQEPGATVTEVRDKDAKYFIVHLLQSRLRLPHGRPFEDKLKLFMRDLEAFTLALSDVRADVETSGYQQEGQAWNRWVCNLRDILKKDGLPCGTTRNTDTPALPFVRLVSQLQEECPQGGWRFKDTRALTLAMYRAIHTSSPRS
jgi:hypothetical protein